MDWPVLEGGLRVPRSEMQPQFIDQAARLGLSFSVQASIKMDMHVMTCIQDRLFDHMDQHSLAFLDEDGNCQANSHHLWTFLEVLQKKYPNMSVEPPLHIVDHPWEMTFRKIALSSNHFSVLAPESLDQSAPLIVFVGRYFTLLKRISTDSLLL